MPASTRNSVVLPEPLWPTRPMRSPSLISRLRPSMARTVTMSRAFDITRPPVADDKILFFRERELAPKIANSTIRFSMEICGMPLPPTGGRRRNRVRGEADIGSGAIGFGSRGHAGGQQRNFLVQCVNPRAFNIVSRDMSPEAGGAHFPSALSD